MRLGLCCIFIEKDIHFRTTTAKSLDRLRPKARIQKLREISAHNASSLAGAIEYCSTHDIGCFRVNSQILLLKTHPKHGYDTVQLGESVIQAFFDFR